MEAGKLRHQVQILRATATQATSGAEETIWLSVGTVYASIEPLSGREFVTAHVAGAELSHRVRLRYHPDLTERDRLQFGARVFHVEAIINTEERNRELVAMCREIR